MITYNDSDRIFKLDTPNTSYIFGIDDKFGYLIHYYYGRKLRNDKDNARYLSRLYDGDILPEVNTKDKNSFLDFAPFEYSTGGIGDYRSHALEILLENGTTATELKYVSHRILKGKSVPDGLPGTFAGEAEATTLEIELTDPEIGLTVILSYAVFTDTDCITRSAKIFNEGQEPVYLTRVMSTTLSLDNKDYNLLTLHGSWARERHKEFRKIAHGYQGVSSRRGESSHQEHPFMAITDRNLTETDGEVYGFNFIYSGNFTAEASLDQFNFIHAEMGINPYNFKWKLEPGDSFTAPEAVMVYSYQGLGSMTRSLHNLYRNHLIRSIYLHKQRPILINNWEATYFDFDTDKLLSIAKEAASVGIEMLVMDDGWFGNRYDDNRALGDWIVNEDKIKGGLKFLVDEVNKLGLKFGIWMEPEMVSPDSDLYRAHPDWAIQIPGRTPGLSRNQLVLDITRPEVWEHTWNSIESILKSANIEYLKWDMNRQLADLYSAGLPADRQGELYHRYVLALYRMQEKLVKTFPNLLIENCSGGGARFDPGMLYYSPQIWTSDDTDAIERLAIQEGTAMIYPLSTMGAHVSDCPNHAVGRVTPFKTRGHVALAGTFGYELDITKIPIEERAQIPFQVAQYHKYNDIIREGDYYRLASFTDNREYDAWMVISRDAKEVLITYVDVFKHPNFKSRRLLLQGLDPSKEYKDTESGKIYGGDTLMYAGLPLPNTWGDYKSALIHLELC
ncbi:MAG: alpha-galactosidase [Lachnospiraceae bacterium]|nr:alpha-galactosidase [Lachnospiraceae bacterium]